MILKKTDAWFLIGVADEILHPRNGLVIFVSNLEDIPSEYEVRITDKLVTTEVIALALRLRSRPDVSFRAMMENWPRTRIVQELY